MGARPQLKSMPRYFFDTYDGDHLVPDRDGLELPDLAVAKAEAQRALPDLARDALPNGNQRTFMVSVRNKMGEMLARASLTLIVEDVETTM
jgi:hypothetical protein